jgi:ubiquinone/menaquinone biosynthesis C-methylase UbiE
VLNLGKQERIRERYKAMRPGYRPALEIYTEWLDALVTPNTRLLDAGCGPAGLVKQHVGHARLVVGVDEYVTHFDQPAEIPTLAEATIAALPFADNSIHLATCSWVLEHLKQPEAVFREIYRALAPGGHFLFITPNANNYAVWMRRLVPNAASKRIVSAIYGRDEDFINPTYYRANRYTGLQRQLAEAGFTCVQFEHVGDPSYMAMHELLFRAAVVAERILDRFWHSGRVHLVGHFQK